MHQESIQATGHLIRNEESIPIHAKCASKYSLMIRFLNRKNLGNGVEFSKLILQLNGESIEMGACRLISEPTIDSFNKRLIFTQDVYDLESLFFKNKLAKLQASFFNLPLLLGHKDKILRAFKDYTADLTYDLNVYRNLFDSLDSEHRSEPNDIQREIQEVIINTEGRKFMDFLDKKLDELEGIVRGFGKEEHEYHGYYFRRQLWPFILNAPFMARTNLKPRGYAGDSEMMSMIYENSYAGNSTFEKLMHKHPVEHPAAQAVRNRRKFISAVLPRVRKDCTSD